MLFPFITYNIVIVKTKDPGDPGLLFAAEVK